MTVASVINLNLHYITLREELSFQCSLLHCDCLLLQLHVISNYTRPTLLTDSQLAH